MRGRVHSATITQLSLTRFKVACDCGWNRVRNSDDSAQRSWISDHTVIDPDTRNLAVKRA